MTAEIKSSGVPQGARGSARPHVDQLALVQEALGLATWIWNVQDNEVEWFGDGAALLGLEPGQFSGRFQDYLARVHPEDAASAKQTFIDCLKRRRPSYRSVERVVWPDGSVRWLETYGRAEYGTDGRAVRMAGVIKDVTEAKQQELARVSAETLLAHVFAASPECIAIARVRDGVLLAVNAEFERTTGFTAAEAVGRAVFDIQLWEDPKDREMLLADLRAGISVRNRPARFRVRGGRVFTGAMSAFLIEHLGEKLLVAIVRDLTGEEQLERRASQSERMAGALFESSPEPMTLYRISDGIRLAANEAWERASGYRRSDAVGRHIDETILWKDTAQALAAVAALETQGRVTNVETKLVRADGTSFDALISGVRVHLDGEACALWTWRDTTALKGLEERARRSERMFRALFESSPEPITLYRLSDGVRLAANSAWERVTGHRRTEVEGSPALARSLFRSPLEREALIARVRADGAVSNTEVRLVRANGEEFDALVSAVRLEVDGEPCVLWSWRDVSAMKRLEQRARQLERKFASLFETSPVPLVVSRASPGPGADDLVVEINDAALELIGVSRDRAIGVNPRKLITWTDVQAVEALRQRALAGERVLGAPVQFDRQDGRRVEVLLSGVMLELGGEPHFMVTLLDVTERQRAERERSFADARYRALFEAATDGIVIMSPDWTFLDLNPAACRFAGYAREELLGRSVTTVFSREELELNPIRPDAPWRLVERSLTRKDGSRRAVEGQAGPMPDGNILVIARDISERKRHEEMLVNIARGVSAELGDAFFHSLVAHLARELGADFAFIAELSAPDAAHCRTLAFVADGKVAPNFEFPVEGSPCARAIGQRGTVIYPRGAAAQFPGDPGLARRGVEGYVGTSLHAADGSVIGILVVMHRQPVERSAMWSSMIEIFGARAAAEIERARAEAMVRRTNTSLEQLVRDRTAELEDANRDLESYNYSISHDLRQPLNAIAGFAELLRDAGTEASARERGEFLREIETNAERMDRMILSLLELSRAGRGRLVLEDVDMRALVDAVLRELCADAPSRARVEVGELPRARGDAALLRQVWSNLIGNALKYSRNRRLPRVRIWGGAGPEGSVYGVSDNGVGFDMRHVSRMFEAFHRLPTAADFEGNGVGLAIVQRILRRHGGTLEPQSTPGKGATFRFTLPS